MFEIFQHEKAHTKAKNHHIDGYRPKWIKIKMKDMLTHRPKRSSTRTKWRKKNRQQQKWMTFWSLNKIFSEEDAIIWTRMKLNHWNWNEGTENLLYTSIRKYITFNTIFSSRPPNSNRITTKKRKKFEGNRNMKNLWKTALHFWVLKVQKVHWISLVWMVWKTTIKSKNVRREEIAHDCHLLLCVVLI